MKKKFKIASRNQKERHFAKKCLKASFMLAMIALLLIGSLPPVAYAQEANLELLWSHWRGESVLSVSASSDGSYTAAGSLNGVYFFNREGELLWSYNQPVGAIKCVSISSDGYYIAAGSDRRVIYFLNRKGKCLWSNVTGDMVDSVAISSDGSYIAAGSDDDNVYFFNREGNLLWSYKTGSDVEIVSVSSDGTYIAAGSDDDNVYFFDREGNLLWSYKTGGDVTSISISSDGSYMAAGSLDSAVYFFNREGNLLWHYKTSGGIKSVSVSSDGSYIAAGSDDDNVYFFNREGNLLWSYKTGDDVESVSVSSDGSYIAAGSDDNNVYLFDKEKKLLFFKISYGLWPGSDMSVSISSDSSYIAATRDDHIYFFTNTKSAVSSAISQAQETVSIIEKNYSINIAEAESLLSQAEQAFGAGNYTTAKSLAKQAKEKAEEIDKLASSAKNAVEDAKSTIHNKESKGIYLESLLFQAEQAFNSGDYSNAESLAEQAKEEAEEIDKNANDANSAIVKAKSAIAQEKSRGFAVAEAEGVLSRAENAFSNGDYLTAKSLAEKAYFLALDIVQAGDWPMFRHDARHTGYTTESIPDDLELVLVWYSQPEIGEWAADSPPVVVDGKVFFVSDRIYCLGENIGNFIWSYKAGRAWTDFSPAVAYGKVFVGSDKIYCLDADNGNLIWSYKTGAGVESSPTVAYGRVFAVSDKIYCLDESNGNLIWSFGEDSFWVDTSPAVADGKVFFSSYKTIYCLDADNGNLMWNYETGSEGFSSPAVAEEKVFINSDKVYCLDENRGILIWSYSTKTKGSIDTSPAVADGKVFISADKVYCLDANNGNLIWSYATKSDTSPAVADGKVFISADKIYCLNADDGKVIWSYETECGVSSSAAIANGKVFFASSYGGIYCLGFETLVTVILNKFWSAIDSAGSIIWSVIDFAGSIGAELLQQAAETMGLTPLGVVILIIVLLTVAILIVPAVIKPTRIQKQKREPIAAEAGGEVVVSGPKPKLIEEPLEEKKEIPLTLERAIYDPCKRDFIERPLPRMKEWINRYDPGAYWFVISIQNNTDKAVEEWDVELETSSALNIKEAKIEGLEIEIPSEAHLNSFRISVPKEYGIVIPKGGAQRVYFKLRADKPKTTYAISGIFRSEIGKVPIRAKEFKYLCDAGVSPEAVEVELKKTFSEKEAARLTLAFKTVQELDRMCDQDAKTAEYLDKLAALKNYTEGFSAEFTRHIEDFSRFMREEQLEYLDDKYKGKLRRFCTNLVDVWINEFLKG